MGDSTGPKQKAIPSWQLQGAPDVPTPSEDSPAQEPGERTISDQRASLIEQAAKFLEAGDLRNASIERKKVFLGSKGLTEDEIQDLLHAQEQEQEDPEAEVMEDYGIEKEISQLQSSKSTPKPTPSSLKEQSSMTPPPKDIPPIITYPEFLLHSQKPPPLITASRLLTTLYVASGAAATIYGTSKYIVEPMVESLTSARHSLSETAFSNLDTLNSKLEAAVSKTPEVQLGSNDEDISDAGSTGSDPARFFNRSAATQTSPHLSRSASSLSSKSSISSPPTPAHEHTLSTIHSRLSDLLPTDAEAPNPVKTSVDELREYLNGLPYATITQQNGKLWQKGQPDEFAKLKVEIRGIKGVLLSARNFPSGVAVR